jgi:hypothetical protein
MTTMVMERLLDIYYTTVWFNLRTYSRSQDVETRLNDSIQIANLTLEIEILIELGGDLFLL